ncbi:MAG: hypothetical protein AB7N76_18290 [Planctomycetota bacterium]
MGDEDLRGLERSAGADPEAAARHLVARVRAGTLPSERLGLLAYLGDPTALLAWDALGQAPPPSWEEVEAALQARIKRPSSLKAATERRLRARFGAGLARFGDEASVRVALAAAADAGAAGVPREVDAPAWALVRGWVAGERRDLEDYELAARAIEEGFVAGGEAQPGRAALVWAVRAAGARDPRAAADSAGLALHWLALSRLPSDRPAAEASPAALRAAWEEALARIRPELLDWVLGEG